MGILLAVFVVSAYLYNQYRTPSNDERANQPRLQASSLRPQITGQPGGASSPETTTPASARLLTQVPSTTPGDQRTPTPLATLPSPVLGGADKIAYLDANDIWVANLDGSQLTRLTDDGPGVGKSNLEWSPDGQAVRYLSGDKCFYHLRLADQAPERLVCFPFAQYFLAFAPSPDGSQVAVSVDNWLYILPNDLALLNTLKSHADLAGNAICEHFDPLEKDPDHRIVAKFTRWSADGRRLAFVTNSADQDVGDVSIVRVVTYDDCQTASRALSYFPAWHLVPDEYNHYPVLPNFGWDGRDLFSFVAITQRESGFGGLFIYYTSLWRLAGPFDMITDCCYRDPHLSPDGSHLLFAYQANPPDAAIRLYLVPIEEIGVQSTFSPLPLPPLDPRSQPQAVLRPAHLTPRP